jgi:hypothetical protein
MTLRLPFQSWSCERSNGSAKNGFKPIGLNFSLITRILNFILKLQLCFQTLHKRATFTAAFVPPKLDGFLQETH